MKTILFVLLLVAVAAGFVYRAFDSGVPVEAARVSSGLVQEFVDEEGKTRLPQVYLMTMPFEGRIESIEFVEGAAVKKDQVVARVAPFELNTAVAVAQAAVERLEASIRENDDVSVEQTGLAQTLNFVDSMARTVEAAAARVTSGEAKLDYANKNLARVESLRPDNAVTQDQLEQARVQQVESEIDFQQDKLVLAAMKSMQAATILTPTAVRQYIARKTLSRDVLEKELSEARVRLEQAQYDLARGVLRSPLDGIVLDVPDRNERRVASGTVLLELGRLEDLEVEAEILSQDVVRVKPGQPAEIYGPAIGPQPARGIVERIYPAGFTKTSSLGVEQQRVKVVLRIYEGELPRLLADQGLGVDYRVQVRVITAEKPRAQRIPRSALFRGEQSRWSVFAVRDGRAELQSVEVGLMNDDWVEIVGGLADGELVVLAPETNLAVGVKVLPQLKT
ncbi:MAG: HlyD family efflux transporter periplasmic adaptor subunit [Pirellulales bacterium]